DRDPEGRLAQKRVQEGAAGEPRSRGDQATGGEAHARDRRRERAGYGQACDRSEEEKVDEPEIEPCHRPLPRLHQTPVLGMEAQGSAGGNGSPLCNSSTEMPSGERTKAMRPSRGGRLIVTPPACSRAQAS